MSLTRTIPAYTEYTTQVELLADEPTTATIGNALDTENVFTFIPRRGWIPYLPTGAVGQVLVIDHESSLPVFAQPTTRHLSTTASNNANDNTVLTQTIPGGALGANGSLHVRVLGDFLNDGAGPSRTLEARAWWNSNALVDLVSLAIPNSPGSVYALKYECYVVAANSLTQESSFAEIGIGLPTAAVLRNQAVWMNGGLDLSEDWTFRLSFMMSAADPGLGWDVGAATVETVYLA
jgi:hypothetical protein